MPRRSSAHSWPLALLLMFLMATCCFLATREDSTAQRILVLYAYHEKNSFYTETLRFFLALGINPRDDVDYVFILQGNCSVRIPLLRNVKIYKRENTCLDFGAYGAAIEFLGGLQFLAGKYRAIIFLNPSAVGPILPKYWPKSLHWSSIFMDRLHHGVEVVGTSLVCLPKSDEGGHGPRIEGMAWAATMAAVRIAMEAGVFRCYTSKRDAIVDGEYGLSRAVLQAGMNLDSLLLRYGPLDWRKTSNWNCNGLVHPTRNGTYEGISVHPLEVVFHKPRWTWESQTLSEVYFTELQHYMRWAMQRASASGDPGG